MDVGDDSVLGVDRLKHLEFIQAALTRQANSSFLIKGWALTIAAAFLAVLSSRLHWGLALAALVPLLTFWSLDGYFLWQERLLRCLYEDARKPDSPVELMSMSTLAYQSQATWMTAAFSRTLVLFYGALVLIDLTLVIAGAVAD